jgi:hypothetical protein
MRRLSFAALAAVFVLGACTDSTAPTSQVDAPAVQEAPTIETYDATAVAQCPVISEAELRALVAQALRGRALNGRVGLGMFDAASQVRRRNIRAARILVWGLAEFIYKRRSEALPPATMARLINGLLCWVGLPPRIPQNSDSFFILPSDTAQVILREDQKAGVLLPPNPVGEPSIITINYADTIRLNTKYDQYPGGVNITLSSPLVGTAVVAVCPDPNLMDTNILSRLRLGHQASFGFEILPPADPTPVGLNCSVPTASAPTSLVGRMVASLGEVLLPKVLHAKARASAFGGGVGGSASEFSPFAPIDPVLNFGGGVGGSASEFLRSAVANGSTCETMTGAIGSPLREACRPQITITTASGTPFVGVPVQFSVLTGGGSVGIEGASASCGALGTTSSGTTNSAGVVRGCWTLGLTPGVNGLRAVPSVGGDAFPGTIFAPAAVNFSAIGNPAAQFGVGSIPGSVTAGVPFDVSIEVQDYLGNVVVPATGSVYFAPELADAPLSVTMQMQSQARRSGPTTMNSSAADGFELVQLVNGVARLNGFVLTRAIGRPYRFIITGVGLPAFTTPWITVNPAAPASLLPTAYPTAAYTNTPLTIGAKALDAFENRVPNTTLVFTVLTPGSTINGGTSATAVTGPDGSVVLSGWQLVPGTNSLRIALQSNPSIAITVTTTGYAP